MGCRFVRSGATAAVVILCALASGTAASAARVRARPASSGLGALIPAHKGQKLPLHGGTTSSLNWSGYAVTPGSGVTAVDSLPSNPLLGNQYQAWYEILPASETPISNCTGDSSCTVTPGDHVTVNIHNVSGDTWSVSLTDAGKWSWSQDVTYSSSESSAEWILEAPTLVAGTVLANVGTVPFGPTSTYTDGSGTHTIAAGDPTLIDLGTGVVNEATPSALASDGQSFNDCAYALSCPAP